MQNTKDGVLWYFEILISGLVLFGAIFYFIGYWYISAVFVTDYGYTGSLYYIFDSIEIVSIGANLLFPFYFIDLLIASISALAIFLVARKLLNLKQLRIISLVLITLLIIDYHFFLYSGLNYVKISMTQFLLIPTIFQTSIITCLVLIIFLTQLELFSFRGYKSVRFIIILFMVVFKIYFFAVSLGTKKLQYVSYTLATIVQKNGSDLEKIKYLKLKNDHHIFYDDKSATLVFLRSDEVKQVKFHKTEPMGKVVLFK